MGMWKSIRKRKWQRCISIGGFMLLFPSLLYILAVFLPDRAIGGILPCIQRRPPEKWRKGQFSPLLLQGCMQAWPRHSILIAFPKLKIATDRVGNELTIYNAINISLLATKNSGLVAIIATCFLYVEDQQWLFTQTLCCSRKPFWKIFASKTLDIRKELNP